MKKFLVTGFITLAILMLTVTAYADEVTKTLAWENPTSNCDGSMFLDPDSPAPGEMVGTIIKCGMDEFGPYPQEFVVNSLATTTTITLTGYEGDNYYCVAVAYDVFGNRSDDLGGCGESNAVTIPFPQVCPNHPTVLTVVGY